MRERIRNNIASSLPRACRPDDQVVSIVVDTKELATETA
jgi:hypothetical protein